MVAVRPLFMLSVLAGIVAAGKCRPGSSSSTGTETSLTDSAIGTTATESTTESPTDSTSGTTTNTATETLTVSTTETATDSATETATSTAIETLTSSTTETAIDSSTETTLTTLMTSLSSTETTTEASTTTSEAAAVITCPSTTDQCLNSMEIMCDTIIVGISYDSELNLDDCAHKCDQIPSCTLFVVWLQYNYCYLGYDQPDPRAEGSAQGWASGVKGRCAQ